MIGILDSGSGGLTVVRAIRDRLPSTDIVYFGDIKNAPYGSKTQAELSVLTVNAIRFLQEHGATSIVSACNSVSASLAVSLFDTFSLPQQHLIEMVGPTVSYFRGSEARLMMCATEATVRSGIYENAFRMIGKDVPQLALPELAAAIEFGESEEKIESIIRTAFRDVAVTDFDGLVLCCTHYPLVFSIFKRVLGEGIAILDPALIVAERVERDWWPREMGNGTTHFYISAESEPFRGLVERLFPNATHAVEVVHPVR